MHEHISLDLPNGPVSPSQVYAYVLGLHMGTPNDVPLPSQLLVGHAHGLVSLFPHSVYVAKLIPLSMQLIDAICQSIPCSSLFVIVFVNFVNFLFNPEELMAERIVFLAALHQFLLVVTLFIGLKHAPLHFQISKLLIGLTKNFTNFFYFFMLLSWVKFVLMAKRIKGQISILTPKYQALIQWIQGAF